MQSPPPSGGMPPPPPTMGGYIPTPGYAPAANYGGFWIRVVAYIIDGVILGIVNAIIDAVLQVNPQNPQSATYGVALVCAIVTAFLLWRFGKDLRAWFEAQFGLAAWKKVPALIQLVPCAYV